MYQSMTAHPDGLPAPSSSSSTVSAVRKSTTHNYHHHHHSHHNHHGTTSENNNNGKSNSLPVGRGASGFDANGLPPKSSSTSPPKTQDHYNVNSSNHSPKSGNSNSPQTQRTHDSEAKAQHTHKRTSGQNPNHNENGSSGSDGFLQWGQRKRSKRTVGDKFSGGLTMPPPPPPLPSASGSPSSRGGAGGCGGTKLRPNSNGVLYSKDASSSLLSTRNRNLEDRMSGGSNGSPSTKNNGGSRSISRSALGKRSHSERTDSKKLPAAPFLFGATGSIRKEQSEQPNGTHQHHHSLTSPPHPAAADTDNNHLKGNGEVVEWPRIHIALSRKEKEDDFFAMKGTKLPHRPKKRSKAIDKTLQYCFPGMWLSDVTRARYEVREKKNVKRPKRRGLKGLESMDSDSD